MTSGSFDVIVIGSGVTGLNAAKHAVQAGFSTANIESGLFGGLVANINELDGLPDGQTLSGYRLASRLRLELMKLGVSAISATVSGIAADGERIVVETDAGRQQGRAVLVASGARLKRLGVPGEAEYTHRGVSLCADCDGPLYREQDVVVVGGGDSAVQAALTLSRQSRRVNVVHRGPAFSAKPHLVEAAAARPNIAPLWNSTVEEIVGDQGVTGVSVRGATSAQLSCTGVFAYIGLEPNSEFVPAEVARDELGHLITDDALQTGMPGLFAAGAVRAGHGGLLVDAIAEAELAMAGIRRHLQ